MQAVGWLVVRWFVFSRIFPSDHDGAALPLPPSLLPSFLALDGWGRQGMMRWNGIGRATDGRTSSCTSLASSSNSDSKEKETGDDGDGERKKEEGQAI